MNLIEPSYNLFTLLNLFEPIWTFYTYFTPCWTLCTFELRQFLPIFQPLCLFSRKYGIRNYPQKMERLWTKWLIIFHKKKSSETFSYSLRWRYCLRHKWFTSMKNAKKIQDSRTELWRQQTHWRTSVSYYFVSCFITLQLLAS